MPEGDTIHKLARRIGPVLEGARVTRLTTADQGEIADAVGWTVDSVQALGKHLLIRFDSAWVLRTHLGMHGRVRMTTPGRSPAPGAVFSLSVAGTTPRTLECRRAYRSEFIRSSLLATHPRLSRLGPDLLDTAVDLEAVVNRARAPGGGHRSIADVILDQRVAAGIGNVYKSEVLFLRRTDPLTRLEALSTSELLAIYAEAARLLRLNLKTRFRTTVPTRRRPTPTSPRLWVYRRDGKPCLDCGTPILRFMQGDMARSTYYCPTCQQPLVKPSANESP